FREMPVNSGMGAPVYAFVHLAAQLVFSSEIIVSHRFTRSDHFSGKSAFYVADVGNLSAEPPRCGAIDHHQKIASRSFKMRKDRACNCCQHSGESNKIKLHAKKVLSSNSDHRGDNSR